MKEPVMDNRSVSNPGAPVHGSVPVSESQNMRPAGTRIRIFNFIPASLLAIFIVAILLATNYIRSGTQALIRLGEDYNVVLAKVVSNSMRNEIGWLLEELSDNLEISGHMSRLMAWGDTNSAIAMITSGTPIVWVRMYDSNGVMFLSGGSLDVLAAETQPLPQSVISGGVSSKLRHVNAVDGVELELQVIESYIPFSWDMNGENVSGVFEIYSDVRQLRGNVYLHPVLVIAVTFSIMSVLYMVIIALYRKSLREERWRAAVKRREDLLNRVSTRFIEAQEEERRKIGRDIHDDAGQWLSALKFRLEELAQKERIAESVQDEEISQLLDLVQRSIESVRHVATRLRPAILDDLGLSAAVSWLVRTSNDSFTGLVVDLDLSIADADVPEDLNTTIFRVLQEALSNMGRHSKATQGYVVLGKRKGRVLLEIRDNGCGFDLSQVENEGSNPGGFGLNNMRERTEVTAGEFTIKSAPGSGTAISASWAIPR